MPELAILQDIIAPYKTRLFNAMAARTDLQFVVFYFARTHPIREWDTAEETIAFPYKVLSHSRNVGLRSALRIYRELSSVKPASVIIGGYNQLGYWSGLLWCILNRRPAILLNESHAIDRRRGQAREYVKRVFIRFCEAALVDGTRHKAYMVGLGMPESRVVIKYGTGPVDVDYLRRTAAACRVDRPRLASELGAAPSNFLYVGRFAPEKNLFALLEAFSIVAHERNDWGLIMVGNGPLLGAIRAHIAKSRIRNVCLSGFKEGIELVKYFAVADVLVLPSVSEPWGLVAVEALAAGVPVIASNRCGCVPDLVVDGKNGLVFDPDDPGDLADKMRSFISNSSANVAIGAPQSALIDAYRPEVAAERYVLAVKMALRSAKA